jgi:hypothetical protein
MIDLQFRHEVVTPYARFKSRSLENICIQERINDVIVLAQEAATAAYHFPEVARGKQTKVDDLDIEVVRQKLSDVVDSRKHGVLRNPDRLVSLHAGLAYEVNDAVEFKYLGTKVTANNKRFGEFDIGETIEKFIQYLCLELSINCKINFDRPEEPFRKKVTTYFTDKSIFASNMRIMTYRKQTDGSYTLADPPTIELEVLDASTRP